MSVLFRIKDLQIADADRPSSEGKKRWHKTQGRTRNRSRRVSRVNLDRSRLMYDGVYSEPHVHVTTRRRSSAGQSPRSDLWADIPQHPSPRTYADRQSYLPQHQWMRTKSSSLDTADDFNQDIRVLVMRHIIPSGVENLQIEFANS